MKPVLVFFVAAVAFCSPEARSALPAFRVVRASQPGAALLRNGDFEQVEQGTFPHWHAAPRGLRAAKTEGRNGSSALACQNPGEDGWFGASQTIALNRTNAAPLVVRGWSKAESVSGSADSGYSLYVDLLYDDGRPLWGQTGNFRSGTHDWEKREFVILPEKPVKTLTLHCLFRGHAGQVWFDDVAVEEIRAEGDAVLFQGLPVQPCQSSDLKSQIPARQWATGDGLAVALRDNTVGSLRVDGQEWAANSPSGFLARDAAAPSDFFSFSEGVCPELCLSLSSEVLTRDDHLVVQGRLSSMTTNDRAITLLFALPLDASGWRWGEDIRRSRLIQGRGEFATYTQVRCGATGSMSLYPLAPVWNDRAGLALALDMAQPAVCRLGYHAGTRQLFIAYDLGLVPETQRFPGSANFRFVLYRFDPRWGFRAAFAKLMRLFPEYFVVRSKEQGIWMPFTDVSTVEGWADFGFRYHEGNNNVPFDDAQGILSFRYTEPMTWWMPMPKEAPRTLPEALRIRDELARGGSDHSRRLAQAQQRAGMEDEAGQAGILFRNEPWCQGAVWSLNPNPWLGGGAAQGLNAATVHWNDTIKDQLYGPKTKAQLDGEYLDSLEGYVTAELNFRRDHFRDSTVPLTFAMDSQRPALFKGLAVFEFTKWICDDVHRLGKLTFANGVPYRFAFLCPWLDVLGTETDWLPGGKYQPASDAQMCLWRTLSGQKPYLLLMNTDYDRLTPDLVERYFQRALFYGMFPSMFSHNASENPYWRNPAWYNRDRPLFKKYIPWIQQIAQAGWQPVTAARSDNPQIWVERFGPAADGAVYLTVFNDSSGPQQGLLSVENAAWPAGRTLRGEELLSGQPLPGVEGGWELRLKPQEVQLIR